MLHLIYSRKIRKLNLMLLIHILLHQSPPTLPLFLLFQHSRLLQSSLQCPLSLLLLLLPSFPLLLLLSLQSLHKQILVNHNIILVRIISNMVIQILRKTFHPTLLHYFLRWRLVKMTKFINRISKTYLLPKELFPFLRIQLRSRKYPLTITKHP